jgi:hypothetical protein
MVRANGASFVIITLARLLNKLQVGLNRQSGIGRQKLRTAFAGTAYTRRSDNEAHAIDKFIQWYCSGTLALDAEDPDSPSDEAIDAVSTRPREDQPNEDQNV